MREHDSSSIDPTLDSGSRAASDAPTLERGSTGGATTLSHAGRETPGTKIGPYKLLQLIGEGGFGSVFMAEQEKPVARKVALKIIKLGMDTRQIVARFEQERQALALMDHPNIAKVLDAGATETGRPFFVMELVKGEPITDYCDRHNLSIAQRLNLMAQVCVAVQHAHTKGIIHRDIKPTNILVSTLDEVATPKIIDFGIAKATSARLTEMTLFTEQRQLIGTPAYMSPEQAEGSLDLDTRTDVYSLGVLLYELLTGSTPFSAKDLRSAAYGEIQRIICEVDPPKPSTRLSQHTGTLSSVAAKRQIDARKLSTTVRGELDWIVMKALEKDRQRRYESASGLATDIRRYLEGEPVSAAPPSATYRMRKFVRRHKGMVATVTLVAAALVLGLGVSTWMSVLLSQAVTRAKLAESDAQAEARNALEKAEEAARLNAQLAAALQREQDARSAEAEQARLAKAAAASERERAEQLRQVAEFQESVLAQVKASDVARRLTADVLRRYEAALTAAELPEAERTEQLRKFDEQWRRINATDAAANIVAESILKPAVKVIDERFRDQPIVDATLRHTLTRLYVALGQPAEAVTQAELALATRRRVLGDDHPDTLDALGNLASCLHMSGRSAEAEKAHREALARRLATLGEDHPATAGSRSGLGDLLREQGRFDEAEPLLRDSVDTLRRVSGDDQRGTLVAINKLGYLYVTQGKYREGEALWREAYERGRRALGPEDPDTLIWLTNLATLLSGNGRLDEADPLYRESVETHRRVLGEDHPTTLAAIGLLSTNTWRRGKLAEAEALTRDALQRSTRVLGAEHPDTLLALERLGNVLVQRSAYAEGERYLREALEIRRRVFGPEHGRTATTAANLAGALNFLGRAAEAETLLREALESTRRRLGDQHSETLAQMISLAQTLAQQSKLDEAEPLARTVLGARRVISGDTHPETVIARNNLANIVWQQGQRDEAMALVREAIEASTSTAGAEHPNTLAAKALLAEYLRESGKLDEAVALFRELLAGQERVLGKEHVRTAIARSGFGRALLELNRFAEAEAALLEADRVLTTSNAAPARRRKAIEGIAALYQAWDAAEPGKGHDLKAAEWKSRLEPLNAN